MVDHTESRWLDHVAYQLKIALMVFVKELTRQALWRIRLRM